MAASCPPDDAAYTVVDARRARRLAGRFAGYLGPYRPQLTGATLCVTAAAAIGLVPAFVVKSLVDVLTAHGQATVGRVAALVAVGIGAAVASALLAILQSYL